MLNPIRSPMIDPLEIKLNYEKFSTKEDHDDYINDHQFMIQLSDHLMTTKI